MLVFLVTSIFTSCEKENPELLSNFVIGEWESGIVDINGGQDDYFIFFMNITEDHCSISLAPSLEGGFPDMKRVVDLPNEDYTIHDEGNTIEIENFWNQSGDPIMSDVSITYNVEFNPDGNEMTWTVSYAPVYAPNFTWTLQTEE